MIFALVLLAIAHLWANIAYRRLYGRRLRLGYAWLAFGALFWGRRFWKWEVVDRRADD